MTFGGTFKRVRGVGLAPMPVQRPIPIWLGGASEPAYRRIGRLADGWFPMVPPGEDLEKALSAIEASAAHAGRDISAIGMEGRVSWQPDNPDRFRRQVDRWRHAGATHLGVDTMRLGFTSVDQHLVALEGAARLLELSG